VITPVSQRWRERRALYVPARTTIVTSEYDVCRIPSDTVARQFVCTHHYSGSYPAARERFGLYRFGVLAGVSVYSVPYAAQLTCAFGHGFDVGTGVELGRLVLLDEIPANAESWFVARCHELLASTGYRGVISMSDPEPRVDRDWGSVFPGHVGTVYQALNAHYVGRSKPRKLLLLPDGRVLNERMLCKIRAAERGWVSAVDTLIGYGADPLIGDRREWLAGQVRKLCTELKHGGNHKYLWSLNKREHKKYPIHLSYPKFTFTT
jgi:hypothetical protein